MSEEQKNENDDIIVNQSDDTFDMELPDIPMPSEEEVDVNIEDSIPVGFKFAFVGSGKVVRESLKHLTNLDIREFAQLILLLKILQPVVFRISLRSATNLELVKIEKLQERLSKSSVKIFLICLEDLLQETLIE